MNEIIITHLTDEEGIKKFRTSNSRIDITDLPKDKFEEAKKILDTKFDSPGIYLLFGEAIKDGNNIVYIGESDNLSKRLQQHIENKDESWIERICFIEAQFISRNFHKTELHYIEKKLIKDFKIYSEYDIMNKNAGQGREPDSLEKIKLKEDIELIEKGLGYLGYDIKKIMKTINKYSEESDLGKRRDIKVYAKVIKINKYIQGILRYDNSIIIKKGQRLAATAMSDENSFKTTSRILNQLLKAKQIKNYGDKINYDIEFLEDVRFNKPSPAAVLLCGGTNNGWHIWKDSSNKRQIDYLRNKKIDI